MRFALAAIFVILTACDSGPEVPSAAENQDLDSVSNQLDDAPSRLEGIDDSDLNAPDTARAAPEGTAPPGPTGPNP